MIDETTILADLKAHRFIAFKLIICEFSEDLEALAISQLGDRKIANEIVNDVFYASWLVSFSDCAAPPIRDFLAEKVKSACSLAKQIQLRGIVK